LPVPASPHMQEVVDLDQPGTSSACRGEEGPRPKETRASAKKKSVGKKATAPKSAPEVPKASSGKRKRNPSPETRSSSRFNRNASKKQKKDDDDNEDDKEDKRAAQMFNKRFCSPLEGENHVSFNLM
jgi:hypothetical protein